MHKGVAVLASLASSGVGIAVMADFDYDKAGELQFVVNETWIEVISSRYFMALDGLSLPLVAMTLLCTAPVISYTWKHFPAPHNPKPFLLLTLLLPTVMLGSYVTSDKGRLGIECGWQ